MQKLSNKKFNSFLLTCFLAALSHFSFATDQDDLNKADSLFKEKRYTQSFELYSSLFEKNKTTPAMLLKMAFISEALDEPSKTLYFINLYYLSTGDDDAMSKMEELAGEHQLSGYDTNEADVLLSLYYRNYTFVAFTLIGFAIIFLLLMVYHKKKYQSPPFAMGMVFLIFVAGLFYHVNFGQEYHYAILLDNNIPMMTGPSPGSDLIGFVNEGHKVKVIKEDDIWSQIQWNEQIVFIKNNHLIKIKLEI